MIALGVVATLFVMALGWALSASARPIDALSGMFREHRRLLREQRYAARDEDERRRAVRVKAPIGYRA